MEKQTVQSNEKSGRFGSRGALIVLLAGLAGGFGAGYGVGKTGEKEGQGVSGKMEQTQAPKVIDCPRTISQVEIQKVADAEQCRALFAEMTRDPNWKPMLSDDEVRKKYNDIEQKRLSVVADGIISKLCITNPDDEKAIREMTSKGLDSGLRVQVDKKGGGATVSMTKTAVTTDYTDMTVGLVEVPHCELRRDPKEVEHDQLFEDIMARRYDKILNGAVKADEIEKNAVDDGLISESSVRDFISLARESERALTDPATMKEQSCKMITRLTEIFSRWQSLGAERTREVASSRVILNFNMFWSVASDAYVSKGGKVTECMPESLGVKLFLGRPTLLH